VVANSHSNTQQADKLIDNLITTYKAKVLLGDISSDGSELVERKSKEYGIPALLYTRSNRLPDTNKLVFRVGVNAELQAQELVNFALKKGAKRFAILYPNHAYGTEMMQYFWQAIEKNHGIVTAVESYQRGQTTFTPEINKMVGKYLLTQRPEHQKCLEESASILHTIERKKCLSKMYAKN